MEHLYKVYPKTDIAGILPNNKRIQDPMTLTLNRKEFIKCMNAGTVYAIINGKEVLIVEKDYQKAEEMFESDEVEEENISTDDNEKDTSDEVNNEILNEHIDKYQKTQMNQSSSKRRNRNNRSKRN